MLNTQITIVLRAGKMHFKLARKKHIHRTFCDTPSDASTKVNTEHKKLEQYKTPKVKATYFFSLGLPQLNILPPLSTAGAPNVKPAAPAL